MTKNGPQVPRVKKSPTPPIEPVHSNITANIPIGALYELDPFQVVVLAHVMRRTQWGMHECWESQASMARVLGLSSSTVFRSLQELEGKKYIVTRRRFSQTKVIYLGPRFLDDLNRLALEADQRGTIRYVEVVTDPELPKETCENHNSGGETSSITGSFSRFISQTKRDEETPLPFRLTDESVSSQRRTKDPNLRIPTRRNTEEEALLRKAPPDSVGRTHMDPPSRSDHLKVGSETPTERPPSTPTVEVLPIETPSLSLIPSRLNETRETLPSVPPTHSGTRTDDSGKKFRFDPPDLVLATKWSEFGRQELPSLKVNLEQWANELRLIRREFNCNVEVLTHLLDFIRQDSFWRPNAISVMGLRNKGKNGLRKIENIFLAFRKSDSRAAWEHQLKVLEQDGFFDEWDNRTTGKKNAR